MFNFPWFRNKKLAEVQCRLQNQISANDILIRKNTELELNVTAHISRLQELTKQVNNLNNAMASKNNEISNLKKNLASNQNQPVQDRPARGKQKDRSHEELKQLRRRTDVLVSLEPLLKKMAKAFNKASKGESDDTLKLATTELGQALLAKEFHNKH